MLRGNKKRAAVLLFRSGFSFAQVAKLLGATAGEVLHAVRQAAR